MDFLGRICLGRIFFGGVFSMTYSRLFHPGDPVNTAIRHTTKKQSGC